MVGLARLVMVVGLAGSLPAVVSAETLPAGVTTRDATIYKVTMKTTLVIPAGGKNIDEVKVWHALPPSRPWSNNTGDIGAIDLKASGVGKREYDKNNDSHHFLWVIGGKQAAGTRWEFTSNMTIRSVRREFTPERAKTTWADYGKPFADPSAKVDQEAMKVVSPELQQAALAIKKAHPPAIAVREFAKWLGGKIRYDASVTHLGTDVRTTISVGRGHCGHFLCAMKQMCSIAGMPIRDSRGLNLYAPDGRGDLTKVRSDYVNIHVWGEVYLPGSGWVEFEPDGRVPNVFSVPPHFIRNNKWFQNYAIWLRENGQPKQPTWTTVPGGFKSDYGVEHLITYTIGKK